MSNDVTDQEYDNLGGYDNESMHVLDRLWVEVKRLRTLRDAVRGELPRLEAFTRGGESRNRFPKSAEAVARVIEALRASGEG